MARLANLTPMGKDISMSETGMATICGNVKSEIEAYDWSNFTDSTAVFFNDSQNLYFWVKFDFLGDTKQRRAASVA